MPDYVYNVRRLHVGQSMKVCRVSHLEKSATYTLLFYSLRYESMSVKMTCSRAIDGGYTHWCSCFEYN